MREGKGKGNEKGRFDVLVSHKAAKRFLEWECNRAIKTILSHLDSVEFEKSQNGSEKRSLFRSIILDNINGLQKAWKVLSPVEWFDFSDEDDMSEYRKMVSSDVFKSEG